MTREQKDRLRQINDRVKAIGRCSGDPEKAHAFEDALLRDALREIVKCDDIEAARAFARVALKSTKIDFPRWVS